MNLVVGSTGTLGTAVCRELIAAGKAVRALVRSSSDPAKVENLRQMGAEIVQGDLRDAASLRSACSGVSCVISTATSISSFAPDNTFLDTDLGTRDLIDAAREAGVQQFIYISYSGNLNPDCDLQIAKRGVEQHLMASGLSYTILRPSCFMEAWLSAAVGFDTANARAQVIGSGEAPLSYISVFDVARFAAVAVGNPAARNAVIELGGPEPVSPLQAVAMFEKLSGRKFEVSHIPIEALQAQHASADNPLEKTFAALMLETTRGDVIPMAETQRKFPDVKLTSVYEFATRAVSATAPA